MFYIRSMHRACNLDRENAWTLAFFLDVFLKGGVSCYSKGRALDFSTPCLSQATNLSRMVIMMGCESHATPMITHDLDILDEELRNSSIFSAV